MSEHGSIVNDVSDVVEKLHGYENTAIEAVKQLLDLGWSIDEMDIRQDTMQPHYLELWGRGRCIFSTEFVFEGDAVTYRFTPYPEGTLKKMGERLDERYDQ
jgi:hypothetical protein